MYVHEESGSVGKLLECPSVSFSSYGLLVLDKWFCEAGQL